MPGSCSSGFRSRPSGGAGSRRAKGLDVKAMKARKPAATRPSTPCTRAANTAGRSRLRAATAADQADSIHTHSSSEPSWPPQVAVMR